MAAACFKQSLVDRFSAFLFIFLFIRGFDLSSAGERGKIDKNLTYSADRLLPQYVKQDKGDEENHVPDFKG